jgi:hypothetical protein
MTTPRTPRRLLSGLALAAVLATACSGSPTPGGGVEPLAMIAAASRQLDASDGLAVEFSMTITAAGEEVEMTGSAVGSADGSRMWMDMQSGPLPGMPDGFSMETIMDDGIMFMSAETFESMGGPTNGLDGKDWILIDLSDVAPGLEEDFADLAQGRNDPTQALGYLKGAADVELVGPDSIDGMETTHYRGTVDLEKAVAEVQAGAREEVRQAIEEFGRTTLPFDVWLDDEGRLRRMTYSITSAPGAPQSFSMVITMDITAYDAELDFETPSRDDAVELADLVPRGA